MEIQADVEMTEKSQTIQQILNQPNRSTNSESTKPFDKF